MTWTNYHTHCTFCDGSHEPRAYVEAALDKGMRALGFSSHAPVPFPNSWTLKLERLEEYCRTIRDLREEYAGRIKIHLGLEIDFVPGVTGPRSAVFQNCGLEYSIGSVHFVDRFNDGRRWGIDSTVKLFEEGLREIFSGDIQKMIETYYRIVRLMLANEPADILGHLDVIKKFNIDERFFQDTAPWYREAVHETLDAVLESGIILEVNTGQLARGRHPEVNPSPWILQRAHNLAIPIMLNSDVHQPHLVTGEFENTATLLQEIGFKTLMTLGPEGWQSEAFNAHGLIENQ